MNFVYPQFLYALLAVSIPVIIHLFNFRRFKKVYFSDIRFLKEVKIQTQNRNRIKHLLILLSRILAVTFLVLAFAQPFIPANTQNATSGITAVSIYIDNSFSMENISKNGTLLDEAKKIAREVALAHAPSDQFQLLTNDFEGKHQRLVSREDLLTMLDEVKISPAVKVISEISKRQNDILSGSEAKNKRSFIISDFQRTVTDLELLSPDTHIKSTFLPVVSNLQNNLYVDSCWFESPVHQTGQPEKLKVRIRNLSDIDLENIPVKLFINDQQRTPSSFSILAKETKEIELSFLLKETGIQQGRVEIADHPVTYDDKFYFSFSIAKKIAVTCISSSTTQAGSNSELRSLQSLFGKDSLFQFTLADENKLDYTALSTQQVILLNGLNTISSGLSQELNRFVQNGGSLVVFPGQSLDTNTYTPFLSALGTNKYVRQDTVNTLVDRVNFESEIFSDVFENKNENLDLPVVQTHYSQTRSIRSTEDILLKLKNNDPYFSKYTYKKGKVYLSAVPLNTEWSNLTKHALFVPLMYKIAMNSTPPKELFYTVGRNNSILANSKPAAENIFRIKSEKRTDGFEIIPESRVIDMEQTIFVHDQIKNAGNYFLLAGSEPISGIAFNYDRKESDLSIYSPDELAEQLKENSLDHVSLVNVGDQDASKVLADISEGKKLWKWCILFALVFLAAETALLRIFRS